jgi:hypothetical protein
MGALRAGWGLTGASWRTLVHILGTVVPRTLATIRDVLTAEKTPEGSDHAPISGTYPIMAESSPSAATEAETVDHVEPEPAPRAARMQSRTTLPFNPNI